MPFSGGPDNLLSGLHSNKKHEEGFAEFYTLYMPKKKIYNEEGHAHFITFSCYKRRSILNIDAAKKIVIAIMYSQLKKQNGSCSGFVIMPDHVHAMVWFSEPNQLSTFMKQWKQQS